MKTILALTLTLALFLSGCASTQSSKTGQAALQIAAIELSSRLPAADIVKFKNALTAISVRLNALADAGGTLSASDITQIILAQQGLVKSADIQRYMREAAVLIDTQWRGVTIDPVKLRALAATFSNTANLL